MSATVFAMESKINHYSEKVTEVVGLLLYVRDKVSSNQDLREWVDDRLTMFANFAHLDPETANKLIDETKQQVRFLFQKSAKSANQSVN